MPEDCAHYAERYGHHDEQRLTVASERDGEQGIDEKQGKGKPFFHAPHRLPALFLLALHAVGKAGIIVLKFSKNRIPEVKKYLLCIGDPSVDTCRYIHHALPVCTVDGAVSPAFLDHGSRGQRNFAAVTRAYAHRVEFGKVLPVSLGIAHHHLQLIPPALEAERL